MTSSQTLTERYERLERDEEDEVDLDALNEVIMAVDIRERGTVGCCCYVAREEKLHFMQDVKLGGADVVEARTSPPACRCM